MCKHYFTFDERKDKKVEVKVVLNNLTRSKIPICNTCDWDIGKANERMHELWKDEMTLSKAPLASKKAHLKSIKNLKITHRLG